LRTFFSFINLCGQTFQCLLACPRLNTGVRITRQTNWQYNYCQDPSSVTGKFPILPLPLMSRRWRSLIEEHSMAAFLRTRAKPATRHPTVTAPSSSRIQGSPHWASYGHAYPSLHVFVLIWCCYAAPGASGFSCSSLCACVYHPHLPAACASKRRMRETRPP
jgi:hypothetical protein